MSDPLLDATDLGIYLNDPDIDASRAEYFIGRAQALCETIVTPLVAGDAVVVERVAGRGYTSVLSPRQLQLAAAGSPYAVSASGGGVYLDRFDRADLRRNHSGGGAFSIDMLPSTYTASVPWWGDGSETESLTDFDPIV